MLQDEDLQHLMDGQPPVSIQILSQMTLGRALWLDRMRDHYLRRYIASGGSKVKLIMGGEGTGKTHLAKMLLGDARNLGYATVFLSARDYRLNDLPNLYRAILRQLDLTQLEQGLCRKVAAKLGYGQWDPQDYLVGILMEDQGLTRDLAIQEIKRATGHCFRDLDLSPSFLTFVHRITEAHLINATQPDVAIRWLMGEKLEPYQRKATSLFERLQKINARSWLNTLIRLLTDVGFTGLVVAIDDLEVMTERNPDSGRHRYTPAACKDICELFRQLIDDGELLNHFLLLLSGHRIVLEDDKRGLISYEALWMRLQTGLVPHHRFNSFADSVDADLHLVAQGKDFPQVVGSHLRQVFQQVGLTVHHHPKPDLSDHSALRAHVIEAALSTLEAG
jgi:hypothetical protein